MGVFRKDIIANVTDCSTTLDSPLVIYYKDRGLELYFNLVQYKYKFQRNPDNILKNLDGAYASITIVNPNGFMRRYEDIPIVEDKIKFVITEDLTDDLSEIGIYQMQIHINNDVSGSDTSVFSIPPFEFEVKARLVGRIDTGSNLIDSEGNSLVDAEGYTLTPLDNDGSIKIINFNTAKINAILTKADTLDTNNLATTTQLNTKVDKVEGHSLVADTEIARLSNVNNYDDTEIRSTLNTKANKSDLHSHTNKSVLDGITANKVSEWNNKSTFSGNYDDLDNRPTIPVVDSSLSTTSANAIQNKAVTNALNNKANSSHTHSIANITNLQNTLDNKANANHTHSYKDLTDKPTIPSIDGLATETFVTNKIAEAQLGGGSSGDIDLSGYVTKEELSGKADKSELHTHSNKSVLDTITTNKINEWNNKSTFSGDYNDLSNPPTIPTVDSSLSATSTNAIQNKIVKGALDGKANTNHTHTIANITNLQTTLDGKANSNHTHNYNDITNAPTIPSIDGLATEDYVDTAIANAQLGGGEGSSVDLSGYAQLSGATFTGRITSPEVSATNYFVTPSLVGEGDNTTYYHRVDFGHRNFDRWDFHEYGGTYNFYQNQKGTKEGDILLFSITPNKIISNKDLYEGNVRVYSPNNKPTASDLGITVTNGEDGATFTPSVDSNGNLSWTNNKGLTNPATVNIKGGSNTKTLTTVSVVGSSVQLTTNEYQYCNNITDGTEIVLPTTDTFTEIHLFIKPTSAISLVLPSAKYQNSPIIEANKVYEFIFTYVNSTIGWLAGVVVYG